MSGIYIPGMEMPTRCYNCKIDCGLVSHIDRNIHPFWRSEDCPLVPVPDHGRLIDANALWDVAYKAWGTEYDPWVCNLFMEMINNAPTIIPAEEDEE